MYAVHRTVNQNGLVLGEDWVVWQIYSLHGIEILVLQAQGAQRSKELATMLATVLRIRKTVLHVAIGLFRTAYRGQIKE